METTTWIALAVIGVILAIIGWAIASQIVWQQDPNSLFGMQEPTMPYIVPGVAIGAIGGLLTTFSIYGFIIGYGGETATEVISEGVKEGILASEAKKASVNVKYCLRCGESMPSDAIYCPKCGQRQS
jgi:ribosomal protein L40E